MTFENAKGSEGENMWRTLAGNALYGAVLFGGYETMKAWRNRPLQVA